MNVPKYIVEDMRRAARHYQSGGEIMRRVDAWFEANGFDMDELRCGDGASLEEIEYGNDVTDLILKKVEGKK